MYYFRSSQSKFRCWFPKQPCRQTISKEVCHLRGTVTRLVQEDSCFIIIRTVLQELLVMSEVLAYFGGRTESCHPLML